MVSEKYKPNLKPRTKKMLTRNQKGTQVYNKGEGALWKLVLATG